MPRFRDIPQRIGFGNYSMNQPWSGLEKWLQIQEEEANLDLDPDFQRSHVWTAAQQSGYIEFILSGGNTAKEILFNSPTWMRGNNSQGSRLVIVDGKQRLNAVRLFLKDRVPAFGHCFSEYEDKLPRYAEFVIRINELPTRTQVLTWYLQLNAGGTPHTEKELSRVLELLKAENGGKVPTR